jgi:uncharacterized membrane protein
MIFPRLEHHFLPGLVSTVSAPAAISICSAVASGMIALTGIVFSLTFLMVQFSATAYSPRLVLWVARDRVVSHALGVFISTFIYALMVIAWVDRYASGKVPFISGWMVVGLLVASMGMFIALIERVALLQINRMLVFTGRQGRKSIQELYRPWETGAAKPKTRESHSLRVIQTVVYSGPPKVIQALDLRALVDLAGTSGAVIEIMIATGDTIVELTPLMHVRGAATPLDETALRQTIELGEERTFEQDPKYALRLMVDIGIKALSPAINDPTTAVQALDQIEDLLIRLGRSSLDIGEFYDGQGKLRLVAPFPTWEDFLRLALDEIRYYGAESVQVMRRMKALIKNLTAVLPPERRAALQHWEERLQGSIKRSFAEPEERIAASVADRQGLGLGQASPG